MNGINSRLGRIEEHCGLQQRTVDVIILEDGESRHQAWTRVCPGRPLPPDDTSSLQVFIALDHRTGERT